MALAVFGINHRCTDLEQLEEITFSAEDITAALPLLLAEESTEECAIISTCNRLECYVVYRDGASIQNGLRNFIKNVKPACKDQTLDAFYYKEDEEAIHHLFSLSCGLDSLVIGENEIAGQVRQTYRIACEQGTNGMLTNKLFHAAFRTAKLVKNETGINEGNCSVGSVAVDIAEEIFPDLPDRNVLVIGAGKIGRVVTRNFAKQEVKQLIIANRSVAKAVELAEEVGGTAISLDSLGEHIGHVDVIVSGTGSPDYLLCSNDMQSALRRSPAKELLMVDIALPRDIDPEIDSLPNVILKNLYDLKEIVERNLEKRKQEIPKAQRIVAEEVQKFLTWKDSLKINSTIKALAIHFETLRTEELEKYEHQFPKEALPQVDAFTRSLAKKYIHHIVSNIKSLHEVCELDAREIHILEHLFDSHEICDKRTLCRVKGEQACPKSNSCRYKPPQKS